MKVYPFPSKYLNLNEDYDKTFISVFISFNIRILQGQVLPRAFVKVFFIQILEKKNKIVYIV